MEYTFQNGNEIYKRTKLQVGPLYLSSQAYKEQSLNVSRVYTSALPLTSIYFTSTESVPQEWLENIDGTSNDLSADNFLRYWLIIGGNEYPITPGNRTGSNPIKYYINSPLSEDSRSLLKENENCSFIDISEGVTTWQLKAMLTRPSNSEDSTPVISGYRFIYTYE